MLTDAGPRAQAEELAAAGRHLEAIDLLTRANRRQRDPALEARLVALRYAAVAELDVSTPRSPWPPRYADPFPEVTGQPPTIPAGDLTTATMGGAIVHHGCLALRGLLDQDVVRRLVTEIDASLATVERWNDDRSVRSEHFVPFDPGHESDLGTLRAWVGKRGCVCVSDAPAAMFELLEALRATSVLDCIAEYLGERPVMSIHKSTFRLTRPSASFAGWHQDGAFIGERARPVNIWMPLTDCGGLAPVPGLDIIPRRLEEIYEPTGPPAPNRVPGETVVALSEETPWVRPEFQAGDALLFDELLVHSTGQGAYMDQNRYGIEFWLFAPSSFPDGYLPMVV